jgi:superfamily II DNA or RNA helicase
VDHVKILQPASDGEFERMCPDGYVYNLEVEGNHTYLANQVVVHNCHHSPCTTWGTILNQIPARYKYGFTATAWRKDRLEFLIWKVVGPIRWKVTRQEAVQAGRIMLPKIEQVETEFYFPLLDPSKWGEMITCLTEDSDRNELLEQTVRKRLTEAGRALILTDRVAHAEHLADRLRNLHPALLVGTMDNLKRKIAMERVKNGAQLTIATTHLLGEGVDVPGWDMLFLVSPFAAGPRVLQALGRIVRTSKGKSTATLIDFVDYRIPMLARAAHGRQSLYDDKERRR